MSKLLIDDNPVMVLPKLATAIGLNEAIVLQQIHYWLTTYKNANKQGHFNDGAWWVYNTKQEWVSNFPWWSENTIWRALTYLRDTGLVQTTSKYNKKGYDRTLWYTIDYEAVKSLEDKNGNAILPKEDEPCTQNGKMQLTNMGTTIPETNSETNTDIKGLTAEAVDPEYIEAGKEFEEPSKKKAHNEMVQALMDATELDMKLRVNAGRIYKASKELRDAGYTPEDVIAFKEKWKHDWRFRKDRKPPAISIIQAEIKKAVNIDELVEQRRQAAIDQIARAG